MSTGHEYWRSDTNELLLHIAGENDDVTSKALRPVATRSDV